MPPKKKTDSKPTNEGKSAKISSRGDEPTETAADQLTKEGIVTTFALSSKRMHRNVRDINVTNLTVTFHGHPLVEEAELTVNYGNRYGFLGRNGSGKSTFMRVIAARAFPIPEGIEIFHLKEEIEATDMTAKEAVMEVDQERAKLEEEAEELNEIVANEEGSEEAEEALDRLNQIYERLEELDSETAETRAAKILSGLGFTPEAQQKKTREFSGGWRMRIALARALFIQPTLLLLDEPTNHLDMEAVVWLEDYLSKWNKILFIVSHSQDFLNNVCTHIVNLSHRKLMYYTGNFDQFIKTRQEKEEEQEKRFKSEQDQIKHMKDYVARFGQGNAKMARQAQSKEKTLEKMLRSGLTERVEQEKALDFAFPNPSHLSPPVLQCNDITFGYPGREILYAGVDFGVDLDSRVALVGPTGAGKSTLLKIMTGELVPLTGAVRPHPHLRIAKFSQHFIDVLDLSLTPLDYFMSLWPDTPREDCRKFLGRFGISGAVQTQIMTQLSDGQKSRVVLAKMAKETPHLLLLDEPTNHLDMESIDSLAKAINDFEGGMILVSHDMRLISQVAKEIWLCDNHTVAKYLGEIGDFKKHLREQIAANEAGMKKKKKYYLPVAPLVPKKYTIDGSSETGKRGVKAKSKIEVFKFQPGSIVPAAATEDFPALGGSSNKTNPPPAPAVSAAAPPPGLSTTMKIAPPAPPVVEKKPVAVASNVEYDENGNPIDEVRRKLEEKNAEKAKKKAEKEAAAELKKREDEEREARKIEKLKESEEAKLLKERERKLREEAARKKAEEEVC
jgi:ATP-binding cassette subfamily F protein 2